MAIIGYVDETDFTAWLAARGITLTGSSSVALYKSLDYLELQQFKGSRTDSAQALSWPRTDVYIDGILQDSATFPQLVIDLQMRVAVDIDKGSDPLAVSAQGVKSKRVEGAVSIEYMDGSYQSTISGHTALLLGKITNSSGNQFTVGPA